MLLNGFHIGKCIRPVPINIVLGGTLGLIAVSFLKVVDKEGRGKLVTQLETSVDTKLRTEGQTLNRRD